MCVSMICMGIYAGVETRSQFWVTSSTASLSFVFLFVLVWLVAYFVAWLDFGLWGWGVVLEERPFAEPGARGFCQTG